MGLVKSGSKASKGQIAMKRCLVGCDTKAVYWTFLLLLGLASGAERVIIKVPTLIDLYKDDTCSHDHLNVESEAVIRDQRATFLHKGGMLSSCIEN